MHRGASPGFDVQRCNPCQPPSCSSLAKGPQHTPGGGGALEISGVERSFFLVHKQDAFCTLFAHSIPPKSLFGSAAGSAVGSDDVGNTDRSSVCESARARQRGHPDSGAEERRERPRAPTSDPDERPRRATPTSEVKVRLTDTCRHARHHVFFSLEEGGGLESAPRGYGAGEATSAHLRHGVRRLREGGGGLVDLEARTKNRCVFWRGTSTSRPQ